MIIYPPPAQPAAGAALAANNLSDLASASAARTNLSVESAAETQARRGLRALRDVLSSDGAQSNRRVEWPTGSVAAVGGLPISIPFELQVPTSNPSGANSKVWNFAATLPHTFMWTAFEVGMMIDTSGQMVLRNPGATDGATNRRDLIYAGFRAAYSGQWIRGMVVFESPDSTTRPKIYINGVDVSASFSETVVGTVNWWPAAAVTTRFFSFFEATSQRFVPHGPIFGALTSAEVIEWTQTGRLPTWCELGTGNTTSLVTGESSTFATTLGAWSLTGSGSLAQSAGKMLWTLPGSGDAYVRIGNILNAYFGWKMRVTGKVRLASGAALATIRCGDRDGSTAAGSQFTVPTPTGTETAFAGEFIAGPGGDFVFRCAAGNGSAYEFDDITLVPLGPIIKPRIQPGCPVLVDSGNNRITGFDTAGIESIGERPSIIEIPSPVMSADGFIHADQIIVPTGYELWAATLERISGASTGTVTIRETSSGGTTVATATLGANPVAMTLSNVFSASNKKLHLANSSWSSSTLRVRLLFRRFQ